MTHLCGQSAFYKPEAASALRPAEQIAAPEGDRGDVCDASGPQGSTSVERVAVCGVNRPARRHRRTDGGSRHLWYIYYSVCLHKNLQTFCDEVKKKQTTLFLGLSCSLMSDFK